MVQQFPAKTNILLHKYRLEINAVSLASKDKIVLAIMWSLVVLQRRLRIQGIDLDTLLSGKNMGQTDGAVSESSPLK